MVEEKIKTDEMKSYSLKEISQWQNEVSGKETKIDLPSLQRGFVWKPNQIEALWDSIFRGYPIGAILMSKDDQENRNLLDGQQRCTSIALGHFNPFDENRASYLSLKSYKPSIWIDLAPKQAVNGQKFVFRCLTQSHPWGYQLKDSNTTLSMSHRRKALDYFKEKASFDDNQVERYTDLKSKYINPWEAYFPIPLAYILEIEAQDLSSFKKILLNKLKDLKIKTQHSNNEFVNYSEITDDEFSAIFNGYCVYGKLKIPEILVESNLLKEDNENLSNESEDPTLFVRLNSAGTRISGEELNYSIYKACFPKIKNLVENIGASYIAPSKVIGLFSRLVECELNDYSSYQSEFNVVKFRKKIQENEFKDSLNEWIGNEYQSNANLLIENAIEILKKDIPSIPNILIKQMVLSNIDMFYVLLLYLAKYNFTTLSNEEKKEIASTYVYSLWFNRDAKKVASSLFNSLLKTVPKTNWKIGFDNLIKENLVIPVLKPELLKSNLSEIVLNKRINHNNWEVIKKEPILNNEIFELFQNDSSETEMVYNNWDLFVHRLYWNKSMLLFAQRNYMNSKFKEFNQIENIDDTNRPWDWDHIYPNSWVYNNRDINDLVKKWVNSIGNFRALSYDDNRSEGNVVSPKDRFDNNPDVQKDSFILDNDLKHWVKIDHSFNRIKSNEIEKSKPFLEAVINRTVNIYEHWFANYFNN